MDYNASNLNYKPNDEFKNILIDATKVAKAYRTEYVATEFILYSVLRSNGRTRALLNNHGVTEQTFRPYLERNIDRNSRERGYTVRVKYLLNKAVETAIKADCQYVTAEHFLSALLDFNCIALDILNSLCDTSELKRDVAGLISTMSSQRQSVIRERASDEVGAYREVGESEETDEYVNPYSRQQKTPSIEGTVLEKFGVDLTQKARSGRLDPVIGREKETEMIINALCRRNKNSPLLIGEPGTGKSAVVEGFAQRIASGNVPASLKNKILYSLDLGGIVAGAKYKGEFESRFKEMIKYVEESGNVIVFIDEIHNLVAGAKSDGMDASEILKPALARGEIKVVGATTINEYRKYIEKDPALERRFSVINVDPPSVADSIAIITGLKDTFEAHHCVTITKEAIEAAVKLSDRYITDRFLPDKAIDLIDEAAARARLSAEAIDKAIPEKEQEAIEIDNEIDYAIACGRDYDYLVQRLNEVNAEIDKLHEKQAKLMSRSNAYIDADDIAKVVSERTQIPVSRLTESERQRFMNLENLLHRRVIGQNEAVRCVAQAVRRAMSGINDPDKPNGTFLFVGPTGVGKTELAKALAEALFADERMLVRIDMSEYMEKADVSKLIGAPPGYVGYDEEGQLTEKVRRKPYSVVLFDEVEKAHPDVFNLMLQIFDDGRLTDSKGRTVDFRNTVIIMTSNAGAAEAEKSARIGFSSGYGGAEANVKECYDRALRRQFKPEFLNRIDEIVYFEKLSKRDCAKICSIIMGGVVKRLAEKKIRFSYDEDVTEIIISSGYSAEYGARPLKRAVCTLVEDEIAEMIMTGEITEGCSVYATGNNGEINFIVE